MNYHHRGLTRPAGIDPVKPITQAPAFQQFPRVPEKYYGDGDPQWLEGRNQHSCQTVEQAEKAWKRDIKHLRKEGKTSPQHEALAELIEGCRPNGRCRSGACALCRRGFQRWFVTKVPKLFAKLAVGYTLELAVISIIPDIHIRGGDDLEHTKRLLRDVIKS